MHGTQARGVRQAGRAGRRAQQHTHVQHPKHVGGQAGGQGGGSTWGAQHMSSGPMLDARHAGQAGETGQADQAGVRNDSTHTHAQHTKQAVNEGIERDAQHSGATCADSMHEDVILICG